MVIFEQTKKDCCFLRSTFTVFFSFVISCLFWLIYFSIAFKKIIDPNIVLLVKVPTIISTFIFVILLIKYFIKRKKCINKLKELEQRLNSLDNNTLIFILTHICLNKISKESLFFYINNKMHPYWETIKTIEIFDKENPIYSRIY